MADAQVSEACGRKAVGVQVPLSALVYTERVPLVGILNIPRVGISPPLQK